MIADPQERKALSPPRLFVSEQGVGEPAAADPPTDPQARLEGDAG